jgi:hypothetical protein
LKDSANSRDAQASSSRGVSTIFEIVKSAFVLAQRLDETEPQTRGRKS